MLSLIHIILILVFNQSLYVGTNAQQDLEIEPGIWKYLRSQLSSTSSQPDISAIYNLQTMRNSPQQENFYSSDSNSNKPNYKALPSFNSYYDSIIHINPRPVQTNIQFNSKPNCSDITEGRSRPIYKSNILSNEQTPVELHHGYRYVTPAISFSNIDHLKNVIYNELGLSETYGRLSNSPHGFVLPQTEAEIGNNKDEISTHETNFAGHQNSQNITILTPVKNLTFTYNYSPANVLNNVLKGKQTVNQFSLKHDRVTPEEAGTPFNKNPSFLSKYNKVFNSTSNSTGQLTQHFKKDNKATETSVYSDVPLNFLATGHLQGKNHTTLESLNVANVQYNQKQLAMNITPSIEVFQNIQTGNRVSQSSSQSPLKQIDMGSNISPTEFYHDFNKAYNQNFQQYENLKAPSKITFVSNTQRIENPSHNNALNIPSNAMISHIFNHNKPNVETPQNIKHSDCSYSEMFNRVLPLKNGGGPPIETIQENYQNYQNHQRPTQYLSFNNNPIFQSEYKQPVATTTQQQYMPMQSLSQKNKIGYQIQNQINKDPTLFSYPPYPTTDSKKLNKIVFPTNSFPLDSANLVTRLPIETNQYPFSKRQETNGGLNEHSYHTSLNNHIQNNDFKLIDNYNTNHMNAAQPNKNTSQIETHANQLTNIYSFQPITAVNYEHINPRTFNYRTIVFPKSDEKLRLPHLIYGSPT